MFQKSQQIEDFLKKLAGGVDEVVEEQLGKMGFAIILFEFHRPGISTYISNAKRADMISALRETADRLERNQDIPPAHPTIQ
ncbi:MAG: hypothetical protein HGJ94_17215 [Desulfosarcina sp.]|nr:hypothetical protein [Desulfosarcina sp.]MBC2742119.1 hypothetical protein [Desulfosarcina sp.]MBC2765032.1 hypothetical protein [Desulfosarcina sp.]